MVKNTDALKIKTYTIAVALLLVKNIILIPVEKTGVYDSSGANG